jgi:CO/xanthine dehydrogenase Mo-binding subunit
MLEIKINRKSFLTGAGKLIVGFTFAPALANVLSSATPALAGPTTNATNQVDAWLAIDTNGGVTVYAGKVELGTGVQTAITQIVAEELYLPFSAVVSYVQGDTSLTPNQGFTAGSATISTASGVVRQAAATAFQKLLSLYSLQNGGVPTSQLVAQNGSISATGSPPLTYGQLIGGQQFNLTVNSGVTLKGPPAPRRL